jgi:hypothetical protein
VANEKIDYEPAIDIEINDDNDIYKDKNINFFIPITENYSENKYLLCYEHIKGMYNNKPVYLSEEDSVSEFINNCIDNENNISTSSSLFGAFLIPHLKTNTDLQCNKNDKNQYISLSAGKSISIPIIFEYFFPNEDGTNAHDITKTLAFDIRTSILREPEHYVINVTANSNLTTSSVDLTSIIGGIQMKDSSYDL